MFTIAVSMVAVAHTGFAAEDGSFSNPLNTPNPFAIPGNPETNKDYVNQQLVAAVEPFARIVRAVVSTLGVFIFLMIAYGGFQYLTAAGDAERAGTGMKTVLWAVLGGGVILASYVLAVWLVLPLGNIFGLNKGLSPSGAGAGGDSGAVCCTFTLSSGKIVYRTIDTQVNSCDAILKKSRVQGAAFTETPGKCARDSEISQGDAVDPTGCCQLKRSQETICADRTQAVCDQVLALSRSGSGGVVKFFPGQRCPVEECPGYDPARETDEGCCYVSANGFTRPQDLTCVPISYQRRKGDINDWGDLEFLCRTAQGNSGYYPRATKSSCADKITDGTCLHADGGGSGSGGAPPPTSQQCCIPDPSFSWSNLGYSSNRGVCFPPTLDANKNAICQGGWILAQQACSSFQTTCTKLQANPPPEPSGCCYWRATPAPALPMCTQRISESLCRTDHTQLNRYDVWFRRAGERLDPCTPEPNGVDCVYDPNAPRNRP